MLSCLLLGLETDSDIGAGLMAIGYPMNYLKHRVRTTQGAVGNTASWVRA